MSVVPLQFTQARKRDGRMVPFDQSRIVNAVQHAMEVCSEGDLTRDPQRVADAAIAALSQHLPSGHVPQVEEIQDLEDYLMNFLE